MTQTRKEDARHKIQLGGLIVKAGLDTEATNVLMGMLAEATDQLAAENHEMVRRRWLRRGREIFEGEQS